MNALGFHCPIKNFSQAGDKFESLSALGRDTTPGVGSRVTVMGGKHTREPCHQAETLGGTSAALTVRPYCFQLMMCLVR